MFPVNFSHEIPPQANKKWVPKRGMCSTIKIVPPSRPTKGTVSANPVVQNRHKIEQIPLSDAICAFACLGHLPKSALENFLRTTFRPWWLTTNLQSEGEVRTQEVRGREKERRELRTGRWTSSMPGKRVDRFAKVLRVLLSSGFCRYPYTSSSHRVVVRGRIA